MSDSQREGHVEQQLGPLATEQSDEAVPGDGAQPLDGRRKADGLAEGQSGQAAAVPCRSWGPKVARRPTGSAPRITPITMAMKPGQNPNPRVKARVPVKTLDNSMFGANHTVKFRRVEP